MIEKIKINYIFNVIALIILISSFSIFILFQETKEKIVDLNLQGNIEYIDNITDNISSFIKNNTKNKNIHKTLTNNAEKRELLESHLQHFITNRYRYVYIVDKESTNNEGFRFLLDGAKDISEKSEFNEFFVPLNFDKWTSVYKTKKALYFKHNNTATKDIWMTYLKPIILDNKVDAIIVIDFSIEEHNLIKNSLSKFENTFKVMIIFSIIIFIIILLFAYLDKKREKLKNDLFIELERESKKVKLLNTYLKTKVEEAVNETQKKEKLLQEQSRLAQMGEMISMIAHQWRQPLAAISRSVIGIQSKLAIGRFDFSQESDREKFLKFLDKKHTNISEYVKSLSETIDDFRNFFKPDKEKENASLDEPIKRALKIVETSMSSKGIEIICTFKNNDIISMYQNEIMQVILNILKNSEDNFLEKNIQNPKIEIITSKNDDYNIIDIYDNGGGIPEDIILNVFDPYFSTKNEKNGTGIGLYMSKIMIEEHHCGKLSVTNSFNGANFSIFIKNENNL